jgi:nucleolar protein 14
MSTIGVELAQRHRTGTLVDRRFGENDETISKEDKMLIRFQRTRQRQLVSEKRQVYNLNSDDDDDGEEFVLTHRGKTLDEIDYGAPKAKPSKQIKEVEVDDSASEDSFDEARRDGGSKSEFGGMTLKARPTTELDADGDPSPDVMKTKSEVMADLISKSKMYRYERQKDRSERMDQLDALNEGFEELRELLGIDKQDVRAMKKQQKQQMDIQKDDGGSDVESDESDSFSDVSSDSDSETSESGAHEEEANPNAMQVDDEFDEMVKRLSAPGVRRAKPSNALLTEEHIAKAERARLMQLEKQRLARMNAKLGTEEEEEKAVPAPSRPAGGDDLDDEFSRQWLPQQSDDDEESEEFEESEEGEEDDEDDEEGEESGAGSGDEEEDYDTKPSKRAKFEEVSDEVEMTLNTVSQLEPDAELPYALSMPSDYQSFISLISNQSPKRQSSLISRLRACHHLSLSPANRGRLQDLLRYLFKRVLDVGTIWSKELGAISSPSSLSNDLPKTENGKRQAKSSKSAETSNSEVKESTQTSKLLNLLEILVKPIFEMSTQMPEFAETAAKEQLLHLEQSHLKRLAKAAEFPEISVVPTFATICFTHISGIIFSPSDRRHALVSPLLLHLLHVLGTCRMQTIADVHRSVFLANETLQFLTPAKRFAGEPIALLFFILSNFLTQNNLTPASSTFDTFNPILYIQPKALEIGDKKTSKNAHVVAKGSLPMLVSPHSLDETSSQNNDEAIVQLIHTTICVLNCYLHVYSTEVAAVELFVQTQRLLSAFDDSFLPEMTSKLRKSMIDKCNRVQKALGQVRMPLQQFVKVAEILPVLTPDFDDSYFGEKLTIDKVAKETKRLKRKIKSEQKGAEKELRKDTKFIQQQKLKIRGEKLAERRQASNSTLAMLEQQQSEMNKATLKRKREKEKKDKK